MVGFVSVAKILVVEDEGLTAMELQRKLKTWGYDVPSFAFSRKEAVKKAKEIKPDLILMDVMLKGQGDGIDAAQEIKSIQDIPIIYLTAYGDVKTRKRAEVTNPTAYIIKPFEENELQDKIETALSEHRLEKKLFNIGQGLDNKLKDFGVILIDLEGVIKYINLFASDLTGFSEEEIVYKKMAEVLSIGEIKDSDDIRKYLNEFIANENTSFTSKSTLKHKSGNNIHIEYTISSIIGENQGSVGASIIFQDVSQQVKDEKSLIEREQKFRNIYSESLATEIFDANGKLLDANPACISLFGVASVDQLKRFNLFEDFKLDSEEVERLKKGSKVHFDSKLDWKKLKELELGKITEKEVLYLNIHINPLKLGGLLDGYLVQFQDITGHRKLEESLKNTGERYLKILEALDHVLIAYDADLKCVYSNNRIKELLEVETDDVIGKSLPDSMKSLWDAEMELKCRRTLETGDQFNTVKRFSKNNKPLCIEIKVHKLFEGLIVILKDVTSTKKIEDDLKRNEELYRSVVGDQSEIICRFNKDLELTFANESYYKFFGLNNDCNSVFSLSDEDMDKMKVQLQSFNVEKPMKIFEGPMKMLNGELRWWQWVTLAKYDEKGHIDEYQSVGRDVTQHHMEMEELQNNINNLRSSIKDKNNELNFIKKSFESQIEEENQKISSLEKLNADMDNKFKKTVQELKETVKNLKDELNIFQNHELSLNENMKLLEDELKSRNADFEKSCRALDAEISIRQKSEEKLEKKSLDLEMQVKQTKEALSTISNLEKEIEDITRSKNSLDQLREQLENELDNNHKQLENITKDLDIERSKLAKVEKVIQETEKDLADKEKEIIQLQSDFQEELSNLQKAELLTQKSLEEKEKILKNVYSGVKTNMQMISSLNRLHSEYVIEEMVNKLKDGRSYLRSFGTVHEKLYQSPDLENVNLREYLDSILDDISRSHGANDVDIIIKTDDINLNMEMTVLSGLIISELVINSLKHGFQGDMKGKIMVHVGCDDNDIVIKVSDDGIGIPSHISLESDDSFGLKLVKTFVEQSEGSIELREDNGASFIIKIPKT
jgi:PAS domain S-box-containing protein